MTEPVPQRPFLVNELLYTPGAAQTDASAVNPGKRMRASMFPDLSDERYRQVLVPGAACCAR